MLSWMQIRVICMRDHDRSLIPAGLEEDEPWVPEKPLPQSPSVRADGTLVSCSALQSSQKSEVKLVRKVNRGFNFLL